MPRLVLAKDFLADYAKLQPPVRKAVDEAIGKFAEHTHAGLHLEKLAHAKDLRIRTIRITQFYRGVVLAPDRGEEYLLLTVRGHDDAIAYAASRRFSVNQTLGVLEVRDQDALDSLAPALQQAADQEDRRLFDLVNDADLQRLGIDADVLPLVRLLATEAHLQALAALLPALQYDALVGLAAGLTPEQVWDELSQQLVDGAPAEVDTDDVAGAAGRTPDRFVVVSGPDELASILAHPFDAWRVFLHPAQRQIAHRPSYAGPTLVTGGAGTGKTVTALHRAVVLAGRDPHGHHAHDHAADDHGAPPILLTTFTRNLADALDRQLGLLTDDDAIRQRIDVLNVDRLAHRVLTEAHGQRPAIVDHEWLQQRWQQAAESCDLTPVFLQREWEQVILAQGLHSVEDYLAARRHGRSTPLRADQRRQVWDAIAQVTDELHKLGQRTHLQVADEAAQVLAGRTDPPYRHVIVDEGQDLHPVQWRLLRAAAPAGPDDLFIVAGRTRTAPQRQAPVGGGPRAESGHAVRRCSRSYRKRPAPRRPAPAGRPARGRCHAAGGPAPRTPRHRGRRSRGCPARTGRRTVTAPRVPAARRAGTPTSTACRGSSGRAATRWPPPRCRHQERAPADRRPGSGAPVAPAATTGPVAALPKGPGHGRDR